MPWIGPRAAEAIRRDFHPTITFGSFAWVRVRDCTGMLNIYVGNLPYKTTDSDLESLFSQFAKVERASIITDRVTGESRGFGFVEIAGDEGGKNAIDELNGTEFEGRKLAVNEARPRSSREHSGGGWDDR